MGTLTLLLAIGGIAYALGELLVSDVQWLHYALIGAGVVLTLLWFNEPDRFNTRRA